MSLHHFGAWHYEHIVGRSNGREWRVADEDDDYVADFVTEQEAHDYVRDHNRALLESPWVMAKEKGWVYA